jgi:hypothetical protein
MTAALESVTIGRPAKELAMALGGELQPSESPRSWIVPCAELRGRIYAHVAGPDEPSREVELNFEIADAVRLSTAIDLFGAERESLPPGKESTTVVFQGAGARGLYVSATVRGSDPRADSVVELVKLRRRTTTTP